MSSVYYTDDLVTLHHGDCREITDWLAADVLVTDPPYGVDWESGAQSNNKGMRIHADRRTSVVKGDKDTAIRDRALALWGRKPAVVFGSWRVSRPDNVRHRLIWHKRQADPGLSNAPFYSAEEEIYILGGGFIGRPIQNVIVTNERRTGAAGLTAKVGHPTPKPTGLMELLIAKSPPGVIADPFTGSGSTLVAAKSLGRPVIGVEIEERYCEIAANRLAQDVLDFTAAAAQ